MEPVSLALGIAPLCIGALKGAKHAKSKIKLLKHHGGEASRLRKRLKTQMSIFRDESQLLLQDAGVDPDFAAQMMSDYSHHFWAGAELEEQISNFADKRYPNMKQITEEIHGLVANFDAELSKLEDSGESSSRGKETQEDGKGSSKPESSLLKAKKGYAPCLWPAKLFLETDASETCVNFRMILEYEAVSNNLGQRLLFLRVRSEEISWVDVGLSAPDLSSAPSLPDTSERPSKVRRVRFADFPGSSARACRTTEAECQSLMKNLSLNLCQAKDVCQHVFECGKALHRSREEGCIGYLLSTDNLTHQLMAAQDRESTAIQTRPYSPSNLASMIEASREVGITVNEQLRLALRLARSVLQYHSTPWWRRNWTLSDLSYFDIDAELSVSLATLHIDAKLFSRADSMTMESVLPHMPVPPLDDDAQMLCGIRNVTLHSLGAALLQIGRWESMDTEDVVLVRKAAAKPSRLGPRYDDLTTKCLYCDFGFGADLNKPQLKGAIYESVVYELEQMVGVLEAGS